MKKIFAITLALLLTLSLVGCFNRDLSPSHKLQQTIEHQAIVEENIDTAVSETVAETVTETEVKTRESTKTQDDKIGEDKAKQIALDHAGLNEAEVKHLFVELDYDDGVLRYEVDFRQGKFEYDYDIDAKTGEILSYDKDIDD